MATISPLVSIVGETASGKSALALKLAKQYDGELICADSWTVYKGFDIGTAKPTEAEQKEVRHHLLDIADPRVGFSAVLFKQHALAAIEDISSRGKLPILVGGTGLYIDAVLYDYGFLEPGSGGERARLSALSLTVLHSLAAQKGIDLSGIDTRNKRRVIRAIETNGKQPVRNPLRPYTLILGMHTDREHLRERIEKRVDTMFTQGLEAEVKALASQYGWDAEPMKGIGYREWQDYFLGSQTKELTRNRIVQATLGLAKRQRTWFKRNQSIEWVDDFERANNLVDGLLNKSVTIEA
jgi:tRNA dimethylallyltransferase